MNILNRLLKDHERLRGAMTAMFAVLGRAQGSGLDDQAVFDRQKLQEMQRRFLESFRAHEKFEERFLSRALKEIEEKGLLPANAIEAEHRSIHEVFNLLTAVVKSGDEKHIYPVRFVMNCVRDELYRHLAYEEEYFPLIQRFLNQPRKKAVMLR